MIEQFNEWNYMTAIAVFHLHYDIKSPSKALEFGSVPYGYPLPGVAIRVARTLLMIPQNQLAKMAKCAQVTVNNVENALTRPSVNVGIRLRAALEEKGVRFVSDGLMLAVLTVNTRESLVGASRSPNIRQSRDKLPFTDPPQKKRGRPRKVPLDSFE